MTIPVSLRSASAWSRALFILALAPIAWGGYQYWSFSGWATTRDAQGNFVCGTGMVMLILACAAATALCVALAGVLGLSSYLRLAQPRPRKRLFELIVCVGVFVAPVVSVYIAAMLLK